LKLLLFLLTKLEKKENKAFEWCCKPLIILFYTYFFIDLAHGLLSCVATPIVD